MATTYLDITNEVLRELNEVPLTSANFTNATGIQKFVKDSINKSIFDIDNSIKHQDIFFGWGRKNICKNSDLINTNIIHNIKVNNEKQYNPNNIDEIRFNHYNVNKKTIE